MFQSIKKVGKKLIVGKDNLKAKLSVFTISLFASSSVLAGGLDDSTDLADELKVWAYALLGTLAFLYMIYKIVLVWIEKEQWSDMISGMTKVAIGGGVIGLVDFLWTVFA